MDGPCQPTTRDVGFWAFVVLGFISHARGTALLMRELRSWFRRNGYAKNKQDPYL